MLYLRQLLFQKYLINVTFLFLIRPVYGYGNRIF